MQRRVASGGPALAPSNLRPLSFDRAATCSLALVAAAIPLQRATVTPGVGSLLTFLAVGVIPFALVIATISRRQFTMGWGSVWLWSILVWSGLTYFWSLDQGETFAAAGRLLGVMVFALTYYIYSCRSRDLVRFLYAYVIGSGAASLLVIWQFVSTPELRRFSVSPGASVNQTAFTLVLALVPAGFLLALHARRGEERRFTYTYTQLAVASCFVLIVVAILLSGSRSNSLLGLIGVLIALSLLLAQSRPRRRSAAVAALAVIGMGLIVGWHALSLDAARPLDRLTGDSEEDILDFGDRAQRLGLSWAQLQGPSAVVGTGFGTVPVVSDGGPVTPHNTHVQILVGTGALGLALWVGLWLAMSHSACSSTTVTRWFKLGQLGILAMGLAGRDFVFGVPLWFFAAIVLATDER